MTALEYVGRQVRWLAVLLAGIDLAVTGMVVMLRAPLADPMATWLMGSAAAGLCFATLNLLGVGMQCCGRWLAAGGQGAGAGSGRSSARPWT